MTFPTPVGGTVLTEDFAPSIVFAVLYGCLIPIILYRQLHRRSWNIVLLGCVSFTIERIVIFSLRAVQAHQPEKRESKGILNYMQLTIGLGFTSITQDLLYLVRCLLVNASFGTETFYQSPAYAGAKRASRSESELQSFLASQPILEVVSSITSVPDKPRLRFWIRRCTDFGNLAILTAIILGIVGGSKYSDVVDDNKKSASTMILRYVSTGIALAVNFVLASAVVWANIRLERVSKPSSRLILTVSCLLGTVMVYRLAILSDTTDSLTSTASGSLNSRGAKATFYIFHMLPEWLAILLLFSFNTREICGTGPFGDWRGRDETERERKKREGKEAKRAEKLTEWMALRESAEPSN